MAYDADETEVTTSRPQKLITNISMGIVQGKVAWVFHYQSGQQESFSLHTGVARQFMQGLQELILALETPQVPLQGTESGVWMGDHGTVRLHPPQEEDDNGQDHATP